MSTGIPVVCGVDNSSHKLAGEKNGNLPITLFYFCRQKIVLEKKTNIIRQRSLLIKIVCFILYFVTMKSKKVLHRKERKKKSFNSIIYRHCTKVVILK